MEAETGLVTRLFMLLLGVPRIASVRSLLPLDLNTLKFTVFPDYVNSKFAGSIACLR